MTVDEVIAFVRRRAVPMGFVIVLVTVGAAALAVRSRSHLPYTATGQLFISAPTGGSQQTKPGAVAQMVAQDLTGVLASRSASHDIDGYVKAHGFPGTATTDVQSDLSPANSRRGVTISVSAPSSREADTIVRGALMAATTWRSRYLGSLEAAEARVKVVGLPHAVRTSSGHVIQTFILRMIIGIVIALAVGLAYDYLDDCVRQADDVERWLGVPVLAQEI